MPPEIFGSLATYAAEAGVPVIVNAGGEALRHAVDHLLLLGRELQPRVLQ